MDVRQLKEYIIENNYIENILNEIRCHNIQYHPSGNYWSCANHDGNNKQAIIVRNNEFISCTNYTRQMISGSRATDIIDLVCFNMSLNFPEALKFISGVIGIDYYYNFDEDIPDSLLVTQLIFDMVENSDNEIDNKPLKKIPKSILSYYRRFVNEIFLKDGIDYNTQQEFNIGYDEETNRITIPIYSEIGDLVGVKGRLFKEVVDEDELKYLYLASCPKSKILYGLNKTIEIIKKTGKVYVVEAEKAVMQLWSYGYKNAVATCGKKISSYQIEMLTRLGVDIIFCYDKDVSKEEIEGIANQFVDNIPIYYVFDEDNILEEKESPSDDSNKWQHLIVNNLYKMR